MDCVIEVKGVTKRFKEYKALDNVTLNFERGKIHGLIGRNGSGKTVLFKCICGFLRLDEGEILVDGKKIGKETESPEDLGVIIESPGFLPGYSGYQNLSFLAGIRGKIHKKKYGRCSRGWGWIRTVKNMWESIPWECASVWGSLRLLWKSRIF